MPSANRYDALSNHSGVSTPNNATAGTVSKIGYAESKHVLTINLSTQTEP